MEVGYVDIHSHINFPQFDEDREEVIVRMRDEGIATITVGTELKTSEEAVALADKHEHLFATIGIHPTDANESFDEQAFEALLGPKVVAVGECGLDYYRSNGQQTTDKERQKAVFMQQIAFAKKHGLPLMLHCRPSAGNMDAYEEALDILETYNEQQTTDGKIRGNFHFFAGDLAIAKRAIDAGFSLSFDGPVTFTSDYDEVIRFVPEDMIHAETDAPFAAPAPHRGKRNEPSFVKLVVARLAAIRGTDEQIFKEQLRMNAERVFPNLRIENREV